MKQSYFTDATELFSVSNAVRKNTFKTMRLWDRYALLGSICHVLSARLGLLRGQSAIFQEKDCFERLSPHEVAA